MYKKLNVIGIIFALFIILGITGCQQSSSINSKGGLYYEEAGEILLSDFKTVIAPYKAKYTSEKDLKKEEIKAIREALRNCQQFDFASKKDVTRKELSDFLSQHGWTPSEAEKEMSVLDSRGNTIWMFNIKNSTTHVVYLYVEEQ